MIKPCKTSQEALKQLSQVKLIFDSKTHSNSFESKKNQRHDLAMINRAFMVYQTLVIKENQERELQNEAG